jgi:DNA-binding NarL/FixJ family response regulator
MSVWTVLVVDDHAFYREATVAFLHAQGRFTVVGTAGNGQEAIDRAPLLRPDVVLIDLSMPVRSGLETLPELRRLLPGTRLVVLSIAEESAYRLAACEAGADAYVSKPDAADALVPTLLRLMAERDRVPEWSEPARMEEQAA